MLINANLPFCAGTTYKDDYASVVAWMKRWTTFHRKIARKHPAVVFDIDQTLITAHAKSNPIKEMVEFYDWCISEGVSCFLVTARPHTERNEAETRRQMKAVGVRKYSGLHMMPNAETFTAEYIANYKKQARYDVSKTHTILLNVGDQWTDAGMPQTLASLQGREKDSRVMGVFLLPGTSYPFVKLTGS